MVAEWEYAPRPINGKDVAGPNEWQKSRYELSAKTSDPNSVTAGPLG